MLCYNLGNKDFDAGHIKFSSGTHFARVPDVGPHPWCIQVKKYYLNVF